MSARRLLTGSNSVLSKSERRRRPSRDDVGNTEGFLKDILMHRDDFVHNTTLFHLSSCHRQPG
jgi:hypothetical protein